MLVLGVRETEAFVEAILNRTPWKMWHPRTGEPAEGAGTLEARTVLEHAFREQRKARQRGDRFILSIPWQEIQKRPMDRRRVPVHCGLRQFERW